MIPITPSVDSFTLKGMQALRTHYETEAIRLLFAAGDAYMIARNKAIALDTAIYLMLTDKLPGET